MFEKSKHLLKFEDDFEFTITENEFKNQLSNIFNNNIDFDVICLSANIINTQENEIDFMKQKNNNLK